MPFLLIQYLYSLDGVIKKIWKWKKSNKKIKAICFILSLSMVLLAFPKPVFAVEVNPFSEKWGTDLLAYPGVQTDYCTNVMPVSADVVGDTYYYNFTITTADEYTYHIWGDDMYDNDNTSTPQSFDLPTNWDADISGKCHFMDSVAVSNSYNSTGPNGWIREDVDNNGKVHFMDLVNITMHYNEEWK